MRESFRADLAELTRILVTMGECARAAMSAATTSLLEADRPVAEQVVIADDELDELYRLVDDKTYELLARQAPVATDLRVIVTGLHVAGNLERMGDLAQHVAKIALLRHPQQAVPAELAAVFTEMAKIADALAAKVIDVLASHDATRAAELDRDDDAMDALLRQMFTILLGPEWRHSVEAAVDGALLGRFYERYADHAVNAGRQVVYLVTGETAHTSAAS